MQGNCGENKYKYGGDSEFRKCTRGGVFQSNEIQRQIFEEKNYTIKSVQKVGSSFKVRWTILLNEMKMAVAGEVLKTILADRIYDVKFSKMVVSPPRFLNDYPCENLKHKCTGEVE